LIYPSVQSIDLIIYVVIVDSVLILQMILS